MVGKRQGKGGFNEEISLEGHEGGKRKIGWIGLGGRTKTWLET